jgi:hypothetical protein
MGPDWRQAANMAAFTFPFGFRLPTFLVMITGKRSTLFGEIQGPVRVMPLADLSFITVAVITVVWA